jgi:hypothetical protein
MSMMKCGRPGILNGYRRWIYFLAKNRAGRKIIMNDEAWEV